MPSRPTPAAPTAPPAPAAPVVPAAPAAPGEHRGRARAAARAVAAELGKFGVIGAVAFVVDVGLFNLLRAGALESAPLTAKVVSMGTATLVAWAGNRWWTFRAEHPAHRRAVLPELVLFGSTNGVALLISLACLGLSHYVLGLRSAVADNVSANVVGVALGTAFRFYAYRTWVFRRAGARCVAVARPRTG